MKKVFKTLSLITILSLATASLAGCGSKEPGTNPTGTPAQQDQQKVEYVDYAASIPFNQRSETVKQEVTVKTFVDGDTTHFYVTDDSVGENGVLKARYLAVNTPESTGKIEEYGKAASNFTKETLSKATSIIIESDTAQWNVDSTGDRYLVWVWYKTADSEEYRNLNIEILQNGLAVANSSANNRYGDTCMAAIAQAKALKLNVQSGQKDPDFFYGDAIEVTLKELRTNVEDYLGMKVAFNGVITKNYSNSVYIEAYDEETDMYYGMTAYYGFGLSGSGLDVLTVGNEARIVGTVQYYETGGIYQLGGLTYREMNPKDPSNIQMLSQGNEPAFVLTDADTFLNKKVTLVDEEGTSATFDYAELAMNTSLEMKNLKVVDIYTTDKEDSSSKGAMTITCEVDGKTVSVRTIVLYDENGNLVTADAYLGKTIDVKGLVDCFNGTYQIKVFSAKDITVH